ncbi:unnamed protein product [Pleuronectes platessa]|uniref:Uncharacterized protein n=1 Tax=Pleuronectes platessa TaxID=8262 RepID=A0A9N7YZP6_PLEPL|nr:unnamed protein product [Pleuronectes platessa]
MWYRLNRFKPHRHQCVFPGDSRRTVEWVRGGNFEVEVPPLPKPVTAFYHKWLQLPCPTPLIIPSPTPPLPSGSSRYHRQPRFARATRFDSPPCGRGPRDRLQPATGPLPRAPLSPSAYFHL